MFGFVTVLLDDTEMKGEALVEDPATSAGSTPEEKLLLWIWLQTETVCLQQQGHEGRLSDGLIVVKRYSMSEIRKGRHVVYILNVHLVFVTKYRKNALNPEALRRLAEMFRETCASLDAELLEFNGEEDHVHLLVNYPPKLALSVLVNALKGHSSRNLRAEGGEHIKFHQEHLWSPSYFAGSAGGATLETLRRYIENQRHPGHSPPA